VTRILTDEAIRAQLDAPSAIAWMREALLAEHHGRLVAPPRTHTELGNGRLVFTTGSMPGEWFGYRSYDTFGTRPGEQVVVVHGAADGRVRGIAVGNELGPRRVGAIGGVAADALADPAADSLAIIGTGRQAWAQLWALSTVRDLAAVWIYSRDPQRRDAFASRARSELGVPARSSAGVQEAVDGAEMIVLATSSPSPVLSAGWVRPGAYVTTLGPKQVGSTEFDLDLVSAADVLVTDSMAQIGAYAPPNALTGTPHEGRLTALGAVLAGAAPGRQHAERVMFFSVGLAGTEVFLLSKLLDRAP
jgi:ornithine cyclodeaminase